MKYWLDTEFIARPFIIDLISIGVVAENGREFYAESNETDWSKASLWALENVRPQLNGKGMSREDISYALRNFTDGDEHPAPQEIVDFFANAGYRITRDHPGLVLIAGKAGGAPALAWPGFLRSVVRRSAPAGWRLARNAQASFVQRASASA